MLRACVPFLVSAAMVAASTGCAATNEHSHANHGPAAEITPVGFVRPLPETTEYRDLLTRADAVSMRSGLVTLQPGEDCGWHSTEQYEELIICLAGAGRVESEGDAPRPLAAGQYAYNPPHRRHCVFNTGTGPLRYIYVVAPARRTAH